MPVDNIDAKPPSPWIPMTDPVDIAVIGKLCEESGELSSHCARCLIQGINEAEPETGKPNKVKLEQEIADVLATIHLTVMRFDLDTDHIRSRRDQKEQYLSEWHKMLGGMTK